jgi:transposase
MADKNLDRKQQAQFLYMAQGKTQKEIAELVGVSERTVYAWIHQYAWDKLRLAAYQAPATIADNLCSQLVELQNAIATREPGKRFPTPPEAETSRKLVNALEKMKKYPSKAQSMQMLETFRNYIRPVDKQFARELGKYADKFLSAQTVNGYEPYQVEYGVEPVSPIAPFMEESDEADEPAAQEHHCPGNDKCLHAGRCHYPDCNSSYKTKDHTPAFHIPPIHYARQWAERAIAASAASEATGSNSAMTTSIHNLPEQCPAPEVTGSISAITTSPNNLPERSLEPEVTGSNSAISPLIIEVEDLHPQAETAAKKSLTMLPASRKAETDKTNTPSSSSRRSGTTMPKRMAMWDEMVKLRPFEEDQLSD